MASPQQYLHDVWTNVTDGSIAKERAQKWWHIIEERYSEPQRHYHTLKHIQDMCQLHEKHKSSLQDPDAVLHAIFFHDIIYNPKASDNEEKSAELFETFARECCLDAEKSDKIKEWILLTKSHTTDAHTTHGVYGSEDKHYLLDFDMAVLGWPQDEYHMYAEQIRQEYIHVPWFVYNRKRPQVLKEFLNTTNIFVTKEIRETHEEKARENITQEKAKLEANMTSCEIS